MAKLTSVVLLIMAGCNIALAAGGPCAPGYGGFCICLDETYCRSKGGRTIPGSPGNYPCPSDPANVLGCEFTNSCPGKDSHTACMWKNKCTGTVLTDPVCPGGNDFICCKWGGS